MMNKKQLLILIGIVLLGLGMRLFYAHQSPEDYDEDNYLSAAADFRELMNEGKWGEIPHLENNREHPPLVKLLYALTLDNAELDEIVDEEDIYRGSRFELPPNSLINARYQSVLNGFLTLLIIGISNPFAALLLGFQSLHVHYSSVAYLDALPNTFTALSAFLYIYSLNTQSKRRWWLLAGASVCFGIAVAAKYQYAWMGVALIAHALVYRHYKIQTLFLWGMGAILAFFIVNPYLWPNPIERLEWQLSFHEDYADDEYLQEAHSFIAPITQLHYSAGHLPEKLETPLWQVYDFSMLVLAFIGLPVLLHRKSFYGWWLVIGMIFLMVWTTQWDQHKMLIMVPYSFSAASGLQWIWQFWKTRFLKATDQDAPLARQP